MEHRWPGFGPADILLPQNCDLTKWSVVACDQYTSQNDYWQRVAERVGDAPSALKLILPESQLEDGHAAEHIAAIGETMKEYLAAGLFQTYPNALIYVERWLDSKKLRRGLVGAVDLECYDYTPGAGTLIRATEGTVLSRIPPRVAVRRDAALELPHIMMLVDDPDRRLIEHLTYETDRMEQVYDFDLMERGGHITGYLLPPELQVDVAELLADLADPDRFAQRYDAAGKPVLLFAIGDGNHSLASAKATYEEEKKHTPQEQWAALPSRYALVELVNLHDESLEFEPIHRVCFGVDAPKLLKDLGRGLSRRPLRRGGRSHHHLCLGRRGGADYCAHAHRSAGGRNFTGVSGPVAGAQRRQRGLCPRRRRDPSAGGADRKHRVPAASYGQGSVI